MFAGRSDVVEKKMFGGIAFLINGHKSVGSIGDDLSVRVGPDLYDHAISQPHAVETDFTRRPMKGFVSVSDEGFSDDSDLLTWVRLSEQFIRQLSPK